MEWGRTRHAFEGFVKTAVYQLRLSPEKKAAWLETSKREGFKSLSAWIEARCDTDLEVRLNDLAVVVSGEPSRAVEKAKEARQLHREGKTKPFPQRTPEVEHDKSFVRAGARFCDDDCCCKGRI
jgi:hypothetical protein